MQGKQFTSSERKGPHKSMHCKFCKPPGVVTPEKNTRPQLETKTKIHLVHEGADLKLYDVHNEPGVPEVEVEGCVCVLEGENKCPKCAPDKTRAPQKKKICKCPKGAKSNPNYDYGYVPKKTKKKVEDDEFWWEKYSREHDRITRETWAAYMAQRRKEKKLTKCQKREQIKLLALKNKDAPEWFQKLSCQQVIYVEFLSTAIRLDKDENITDRTYFILGGLGLYPRPKRLIIKKCLRFCHYNSIQFLNQLRLLTKDDDFFNELPKPNVSNRMQTWNDKLLMNAICHLEFPYFLRELMDRLPILPRERILPPIPYPVYPKLPKKKYDNPYEEPIWEDRLNWVEKEKIDQINRARENLETKRVKIPALALVKRPSLIDARPPFLAQIEANEQSSRGIKKVKEKKKRKRHRIEKFDSAVDMTAIAGIKASEVSTVDKADPDEICLFLREPEKPEFTEDDVEESEKITKFLPEPESVTTEIARIKPVFDFDELSDTEVDIPFKSPPKTESGVTIRQPCAPPDSSPAPPATHYDIAKREIGVINEELCKFHPFVTSSTQTLNEKMPSNDFEVTSKLISAAEKLKELADKELESEVKKKGKKKIKKKRKIKKKKEKKHRKKRPKGLKTKTKKKTNRKGRRKKKVFEKENIDEEKLLENTVEESKGDENENENENENDAFPSYDFAEKFGEDDDFILNFALGSKKMYKKKIRRKESIISDPDPDPDTENEWTSREPCLRDMEKTENSTPIKKNKKKKKRKSKKSKKSKKLKKIQDKYITHKKKIIRSKERPTAPVKLDKETMTECYPGEYDYLYSENKEKRKKEKKSNEEENLFQGDIQDSLQTIIQDLAEEGFLCASYDGIHLHPDVVQLIQYLKGEIITKKKREFLINFMKLKWTSMKDISKFPIPDLGIPNEELSNLTWKDKTWISRIADKKKDEFYFKIASNRAQMGRSLYNTLNQHIFGTPRFLKIFYAYMLPRYEDAILRGLM